MDRPSISGGPSSQNLLQHSEGVHHMAERLHSNNFSHPSLSSKYSLPAAPQTWGTIIDIDVPEPDDFLHNPVRGNRRDDEGSVMTIRGMANLGCLLILGLGCLMLFAGYPILLHFMEEEQTTQGGFNLGGINATGQLPEFVTNHGLIDKDTPQSVYTKKSYLGDEEMVLVFSDEFNQDGRTFFPGDDPFWEAVDLHYWGTNNLEWYDASQPTTGNGSLILKLEEVANPADNHNMRYRSAMLQSWNKFCFTGGIMEASVRLPGSPRVGGLWPAVWAMGNLGRAGYGGTLDGMWPYTYDTCDVGTLPNQTYPGTQTPVAALRNGDPNYGNVLSYLPGQKLSSCTCPGETHPGPMRANGSYVGRSAPEIDIIEATVENGVGRVSLSAQWAPFNARYDWKSNDENLKIYDANTHLNGYKGGSTQQTTSGLADTNQNCYEETGGCFATYAMEYQPGEDGYIGWVNDAKLSWSMRAAGMGPDTETEIGTRPVPVEPLYAILNLGISENFSPIDYNALKLPATMLIDWIRIYQPANKVNYGCDPKEYPTSAYIEAFEDVYTNPNITTWEQAQQPWPKNRLLQPGQVC